MEASDAAETISEVAEDDKSADTKFRSRAALVIALMAMLLAITSLGGSNVAEDMISSNIQASNLWAFYQAKNTRQTSLKVGADLLEAQMRLQDKSLTPELRQSLTKKIQEYNETVACYDNEPNRAKSKKELTARAKAFELQHDRALKQDTNFDLAEALFQIGIVLASVAILSYIRFILKIGIALGVAATVLMLNGFFLVVQLPF